MAEEKTQSGCGCGAGASCCGAPKSEAAEPAPAAPCCCGGETENENGCAPAAASPDAAKYRRVALVLLLLFAGVVLVHGMLTRDRGGAAEAPAASGDVRD